MFKLEFDEAPPLVLVQDKKRGVPELYINGKRVCRLKEVTVSSGLDQVPEVTIKTVIPVKTVLPQDEIEEEKSC